MAARDDFVTSDIDRDSRWDEHVAVDSRWWPTLPMEQPGQPLVDTLPRRAQYWPIAAFTMLCISAVSVISAITWAVTR